MKKLMMSALCVVLLASCRKEKTGNEPAPAPSMKALVKVENNAGKITSIIHDNKGRVMKVTEGTYIFGFDYNTPGKVKVTQSAGTAETTYDGSLNSMGFVTRLTSILPDGTNGPVIEYEYSADGYLTKSVQTGPGYTAVYEFTVVNGNLLAGKYFLNGVLKNTYQYSYEEALMNTAGADRVSDISAYSKLFGKRDTNPWKAIKEYDKNGMLTGHRIFTHEVTSSGYISKTTSINSVTGTINWSENYTY